MANLLSAIEGDSAVGICASRMIAYGTNLIDSAGDGYATSLKGFKRGEGDADVAYATQEYVFGACAGAALYRRKMLDEVGFFDEDFFLIHEDTDLNFRAQLAGWKVLYVPSAIVYHKVRSTIGHMSDSAVYFSLRNSEFVRIKNIPLTLFLRCLLLYALGTILDFLYFSVKHGKPLLFLKAKVDVVKMMSVMLGKRRKILNMKKMDNKYLYGMMTPVWSRHFFLQV
jgi:GT2 family glycosyltransferase